MPVNGVSLLGLATWIRTRFLSARMSTRSRFMVSRFHLLVVAAFRAGKRAYLPGAVRRHDGGLVPVEDVAAGLAALPEGHHRAPLADDLAARHLNRHLT